MSTFDEITKEKQRLGEALARVDAQREKLTSQLNELEATERVLTRYSTGTSTIRFLPWQLARRSKKSPLHAKAFARTMSAPRLPDTSGPAASKSAMGSSMPHGRAGRSNASRSEAR